MRIQVNTISYLKIISKRLWDLDITEITNFSNCDYPTTFFKLSEYFRPNHSLYGLGHQGNSKKYYLISKSVARKRYIFSTLKSSDLQFINRLLYNNMNIGISHKGLSSLKDISKII